MPEAASMLTVSAPSTIHAGCIRGRLMTLEMRDSDERFTGLPCYFAQAAADQANATNSRQPRAAGEHEAEAVKPKGHEPARREAEGRKRDKPNGSLFFARRKGGEAPLR